MFNLRLGDITLSSNYVNHTVWTSRVIHVCVISDCVFTIPLVGTFASLNMNWKEESGEYTLLFMTLSNTHEIIHWRPY